MTNLDDNSIVFYINAKETSKPVAEALKEVIKRKAAIQDLVNRRNQLQGQVQIVDQEQARIRQNMAQLEKTSDLYNRYVKKFGEQEDQVEAFRKQIKDLTDEETKLRKALDTYLLGLELS